MTVNVVTYNYGFTGPVGANPIARQDLPPAKKSVTGGGGATLLTNPGDILQFDDNRTYTLEIDGGTAILGTKGAETAIQGAGNQRPYIQVLSSGTTAAANLTPGPQGLAAFRIEGLWLGSAGSLGDFVIERAPGTTATLDWDTITISGATLDPGGTRADNTKIPALRILVKGRVGTLTIERSIVGAIKVNIVAPPHCDQSGIIENLIISDSIVDGTANGNLAIDCPTGQVTLSGVTVLGDLQATQLLASNAIVLGQVRVRNQEASCFRFSAALPPDPSSSLPRVFHPPRVPTTDGSDGPIIGMDQAFFTSLTFGKPGYASLSLAAPPQIVSGGENGSEMGAFWFLDRPIALRSVEVKVDEFKPAGVIAQYIFEEEHAENTVR